MTMVICIGPKELHRRIVESKPVCVVAASCDQLNNELLDVVDEVRYGTLMCFQFCDKQCVCCRALSRSCFLSVMIRQQNGGDGGGVI